jgi:hypothetical protein
MSKTIILVSYSKKRTPQSKLIGPWGIWETTQNLLNTNQKNAKDLHELLLATKTDDMYYKDCSFMYTLPLNFVTPNEMKKKMIQIRECTMKWEIKNSDKNNIFRIIYCRNLKIYKTRWVNVAGEIYGDVGYCMRLPVWGNARCPNIVARKTYVGSLANKF